MTDSHVAVSRQQIASATLQFGLGSRGSQEYAQSIGPRQRSAYIKQLRNEDVNHLDDFALFEDDTVTVPDVLDLNFLHSQSVGVGQHLFKIHVSPGTTCKSALQSMAHGYSTIARATVVSVPNCLCKSLMRLRLLCLQYGSGMTIAGQHLLQVTMVTVVYPTSQLPATALMTQPNTFGGSSGALCWLRSDRCWVSPDTSNCQAVC